MVNKEFTAQFFKAEKRDGSGTGEKLRENQVLQSLLLEDGVALLEGLQGCQPLHQISIFRSLLGSMAHPP